MNTPVNFEIAKLLNEKGFEQNKFNTPWYNELGSFNGRTDINKDGKTFSEVYPNESSFYGCAIKEEHKKEFSIQSYSAPTIAEVVMWLYEKHGIWIIVNPIPYSDNLTHWRWEYKSSDYFTRAATWKDKNDHMSPTKAYSAAILYTLNNLVCK